MELISTLTLQAEKQSHPVCQICSASLPTDARFCGFDGTELSIQAIGNVPTPETSSVLPKTLTAQFSKVCPVCARKFPLRALFCAGDGTELKLLCEESNEGSIFASAVSLTDAAHKSTSSVMAPQDLKGKLVGKLLANQYLLESIIAEDDVSTLYLALDQSEGKNVTVRVVHSEAFTSADTQEDFEKRCRLMDKLNCENIVRLFQFGSINPVEPYVVTEYLKGQTLSETLTNQGLPPLKVIGNIIFQLCNGLEEAHRAGLVHGDLRSANVILQEDSDQCDWLKINNFALANYLNKTIQLASGVKVRGTLEYIAPEYFRGEVIDSRADLYSLGIIVYEMLTGTLPFVGENAEVIAKKHLTETSPPLNILRLNLDPESTVSLLVSKALEKDPQKRFQSAAEFRSAFEKALA